MNRLIASSRSFLWLLFPLMFVCSQGLGIIEVLVGIPLNDIATLIFDTRALDNGPKEKQILAACCIVCSLSLTFLLAGRRDVLFPVLTHKFLFEEDGRPGHDSLLGKLLSYGPWLHCSWFYMDRLGSWDGWLFSFQPKKAPNSTFIIFKKEITKPLGFVPV